MIEQLKENDYHVNQKAFNLLVKLNDDRSIEPLIKKLDAENRTTRGCVAKVLGNLSDSRAVEPLIDRFKDKSENNFVRSSAAQALTKLATDRIADLLITVISDESENTFIRISSIRVLEELGDIRAVNLFINNLEESERDIIWKFAIALGNLGNSKAVEPLINKLEKICDEDSPFYDDQNLISSFAEALGKLGDSRAAKPLIKVIFEGLEGMKEAAIIAIGKIGSSQAIEYIIKGMEDREIHYCWSFSKSLIRAGEKAIKPIVDVLKDGNVNERRFHIYLQTLRKLNPLAEHLMPLKPFLEFQIQTSSDERVKQETKKLIEIITKDEIFINE